MAQLNGVKFNRIKLQQLKIILRYICGGALMTVIRAGLVGLQVSSDISGQILCSLLIHLCSLIKEHVKFAESLGLQPGVFFSLHVDLRGLYVALRYIIYLVIFTYLSTRLVGEELCFIPLDIDSILHSAPEDLGLFFDSMYCLQ